MLDVVIRGADVVDGTGAPRRRADVGITDGVIVDVGRIGEAAHRTVDADGLVLAPGFVDVHTHFDAQVFWDPDFTPSSWHGVTTVVMGNCGFGLAPSHPADRDLMLAALLTRFGLYAGMFGGFGGGNRNNNSNNTPVWLIVLAVSVLTYVISFILIRTISRYREYAADRGSALSTGAPENLMSALQKISSQITMIPDRDLREVAGMNAFFIIPTSVKQRTAELFMDHPPLEKRLAALEEIAREMGRPVA